MKNSLFIRKKTIAALVISLLVFLLTGILSSEYVFNGYFRENSLWYMALILFWMFYLNKHLASKKLRYYMSMVGGFLLLWFITQAIRYTLCDTNYDVQRYAMYLGFIPQNIVPVYYLYGVLSIGKYDEEKPDKKWYILLVIAIILGLIFMTNDLHELAYSFPSKKIADVKYYKYGPFYFISCGWQIILYFMSVIIALKTSLKAEFAKFIFVPFIPVVLGIVWMIFHFLNYDDNTIIGCWNYPQVLAFVIIGAWEGLSVLRVIPINDGYEKFLAQSGINALITDENDNVVIKSENVEAYSDEILLKAKKGQVVLNDSRISAKKIPGGYAYYAEDIAVINGLMNEIEQQSEGVAEYNELLSLENDLKKKNTTIETKNELYDFIFSTIKAQVLELKNVLVNITPDDENYLKTVRYSAVLISYVKRMSNLMILSMENEFLIINDLKYSLLESAEYLNHAGVSTGINIEFKGFIPADAMILVYEMICHILGAAFPTLSCVTVNIYNNFNVRVTVENSKGILDEKFMNYSFKKYVAQTVYETEDEITIYDMIIKEADHD